MASNEASVMNGQLAITRVDKFGQLAANTIIVLSFIC